MIRDIRRVPEVTIIANERNQTRRSNEGDNQLFVDSFADIDDSLLLNDDSEFSFGTELDDDEEEESGRSSNDRIWRKKSKIKSNVCKVCHRGWTKMRCLTSPPSACRDKCCKYWSTRTTPTKNNLITSPSGQSPEFESIFDSIIRLNF